MFWTPVAARDPAMPVAAPLPEDPPDPPAMLAADCDVDPVPVFAETFDPRVLERKLRASRPKPPRLPRNCGANSDAYRSADVVPVSRSVCTTGPAATTWVRTAAIVAALRARIWPV